MNNEDGQLAYCIVTHNHPEVIKDVLNKIVNIYKKYNIDIYIYDSSENEETYQIVKGFNKEGYEDVYHIKIDINKITTVSMKLLLLFQGYGLKKKYKYIWPIKDRACFDETVIACVMDQVNQNYDAMFLDIVTYPWIEDEQFSAQEIYYDAKLFFKDWSWLATSLEVTIFNRETLLENMEWEEFKKNNFFETGSGFDHYVVLFQGLSRIETPKVKVFYGENIKVKNSKFSTPSSWQDRVFDVWLVSWPRAVNSLSKIYEPYKKKVIQQGCSVPYLFGSNDYLIRMQQKNILTTKVYEEYGERWRNLTGLDEIEFELIAKGKFFELLNYTLKEFKMYFEKNEYSKAHSLLSRNNWLFYYWSDDTYNILLECFVIYNIEKIEGIQNWIFRNSPDYNITVDIYRNLCRLVRRLEFDLIPDLWTELVMFIKQNNISMIYLLLVMQKETSDQERTLGKVLELFKIFQYTPEGM